MRHSLQAWILTCLIFKALVSPSIGEASSLLIQYSGEVSPIWSREFNYEAGLIYEWVTRMIPDVNRATREERPIHVVFSDVGSHLGWVHDPLREPKMANTVFINRTLEGSWKAKLVLVHELTHLLRHQYNPLEERWLDEGLANLTQNLYAGQWPKLLDDRICDAESIRLSNDPSDYSRQGSGYLGSALLVHYLYKKLGGNRFLSKVATSHLAGWRNIEVAAENMARSGLIADELANQKREGLWFHFALALYFNRPARVPSFGLSLLDYGYSGLAKRDGCKILTRETNHSASYSDGSPAIWFSRTSLKLANSPSNAKLYRARLSGDDIRIEEVTVGSSGGTTCLPEECVSFALVSPEGGRL